MTMAPELACTCPGDHFHLPIEGNSPGLGPRAEASGIYQEQFCESLGQAIDQIVNFKGHDTALLLTTGSLKCLVEKILLSQNHQLMSLQPHLGYYDDYKMKTCRRPEEQSSGYIATLGHPTRKELVRLLQNKRASKALLSCSRA